MGNRDQGSVAAEGARRATGDAAGGGPVRAGGSRWSAVKADPPQTPDDLVWLGTRSARLDRPKAGRCCMKTRSRVGRFGPYFS